MNPLNQCTCTMKWPHKVLLPHAALRVLYVVVKYWFISFFEFRRKGNTLSLIHISEPTRH